MFFVTKFALDDIEFFEIKNMLVDKTKKSVKIIGQKLEIKEYDPHIRSYVINKKLDEFIVDDLDKFSGLPIHMYYLSNGIKVLKVKNYY